MHACIKNRKNNKKTPPSTGPPVLFTSSCHSLRRTAQTHKSLYSMIQFGLNPVACLQYKRDHSSKNGSNADELSSCASCECRLSGCGNRRGTASNGAVPCDESEVGASEAGGVIAVDYNGAITKEGCRALDSGEVEVEIAGSWVVSIRDSCESGCRRENVMRLEDGNEREDADWRKTYVVWKGLVVILPCLPERSPTWQFAGSLLSHGGFSPRM